MLSYDSVCAYSLSNGHIRKIMDRELKQIAAVNIDKCSEKISKTYSRLVAFEFGGDVE